MRMVIFGSGGYLGSKFMEIFPDAEKPKSDIGDRGQVVSLLEEMKPDVVINAVGRTGRPNVDWCEDHREETVWSNVAGPLVLLNECFARGIYWVHLGSGCVYEGDNGGEGFREDDLPNFMGSFYSRSKAWIEQILKEFPEKVLVLRLRMPFDSTKEERNLITKLARYDRVLDVENSITHVPEFIKAARMLIEKRRTGIYNIVNPGIISPYRIMEMYREIVDPSHEFERLTKEELQIVARAPRSNCVLNTDKLKGEGIELKPVDEAVRESLVKLRDGR